MINSMKRRSSFVENPAEKGGGFGDCSSVVRYGDDVLRARAEEINNIDHSIVNLSLGMSRLMKANKGVGFAAPQAGVPLRMIVVDVRDYFNEMTLINPSIRDYNLERTSYFESCLSIPGITAEVYRPSEIIVSAVDLNGRELEIEAGGLLARVLQHEIDHIDGKLFVDYLSGDCLKRYLPRLKKIEKKTLKKLNAEKKKNENWIFRNS